jgi:hypothetical protein
VRAQNGNVLFLILIAVALFAALSYAVTRSTRSGGKGIAEEKVTIGASRIMQFTALLRSEVQRLRLSGCAVENLDWRNKRWKRIDGNPSEGIQQPARVPKAGCAVFSDYGGPVAPVDFAEFAYPNYDGIVAGWAVKGGHAIIGWVDKAGAGSDETDVALEIRGMDLNVCRTLLDPATRPALFDEAYTLSPTMNTLPPDYTTTGEIVDEPGNAGQFYIHQGISSQPACYVGAVILDR